MPVDNDKAALPKSHLAVVRDDPIAAALKRLHNDIVEEEVPDAFAKIVAEIEARLDRQ